MTLRAQITKIRIAGFKSIRSWDSLEPGAMNVLIGPNGAGKSNLIGFFRLLSWMMQGKLGLHVGQGASALLFDGPAKTKEISASLEIRTDKGVNEYAFSLFHVAGRDEFIFSDERFRFTPANRTQPYRWNDLGSGHRESALIEAADSGPEQSRPTARAILALLRSFRIHQFHNTSDTARLKTSWLASDSLSLKEDAGNLAPFLLRLQREAPASYRQIVAHCRRLLPFFEDFVLVENREGRVLLQWKEFGSDMVFDTSVASDGMIRAFALLALLCQPPDDIHDVLFLDEPELGLHPTAIELVGALLQSVSAHAQVFVATQSPYMLNEFEPEQVTVIERRGRESTFKKLSSVELGEWLDDYSMADLWWKNILGGKP